MAEFALQFPPADVSQLASRFSYSKDDQPCLEAGDRARHRGYYTRDELIMICEWKTGRSKGLVARNTDEDVEFVTTEALAGSGEITRMSTLRWLWGVDVPTASSSLLRLSE